MNSRSRLVSLPLILLCSTVILSTAQPASALSASELRKDAQGALDALYQQQPSAKSLGAKAKAILVFPNIVKAGFIVAGQYGEGVLYKGGKSSGYYSSVAVSGGFQAGAQGFAYALFLMTDKAVHYLNKSEGWELGAGPSIVIIDVGKAANFSTTTLQDDVYAYIYDQKGLMGGVSVEGTKVTKISK